MDSIEIQKVIDESLENLVLLFIKTSTLRIVIISISFFQGLDFLDFKLYHIQDIFAYLNAELRGILEYSDLYTHDFINVIYDFVLEIALKDICEKAQYSLHGV